MKKRVLSLVLAFVLSFSMMPMSAFAEEAGTVTEQKAQNSENTADVSTTGEETTGEETVEVSTTGEDISGGNAVTKYAAVEAAQALINALPEEVTAENADELQAQLMAIDKALEALNDEQRAELDMTRLENICAALNGLVAVQDTHDHGTMTPWTDADSLPDDGKSYYLDIDVTLHSTWAPANGTVLCLNGHSITMNEDATAVITIESGVTFTLYDCSDTGNGKITHGTNGTTGSKYTGRGVSVDGTFNMYGGEITGNTVYKGTTFSAGSGGGVNVNGGTFNMNGGTISNNTADTYGSGVYVDAKGVFNMFGGTITENLRNGGVALSDASTFNMYDTAVISNNAHGADGGGVYVRSSIFNMHGGTIIGNRVTSSANDGGGVALMGTGSFFTMYGGSIVGNETLRSGGGVYVDNQNVFYMQGGTITGNNVKGDSDDSTYKKYYNGGGVFVGGGYKDSSSTYISATFKVSGSARITGNTKGATTKDDKTGCYTGGTSNNVFLLKYNDNAQQATITIADTLTDGASIGVTTQSTPTENSPVTFAKAGEGYALTADDAAHFSGDADENYYPVLTEGVVKLYPAKPHMHLICGETCNHDGDETHTENLIWKGISSLSDIKESGNYYLTADTTFNNSSEHIGFPSYNVNLCLNGKKLTVTGNLLRFNPGATGSKNKYVLCDCNEQGTGKISGGIAIDAGSFDMYGGTITGGKIGVEMRSSVFNMYGGSITGNSSRMNRNAGGVDVGSGTFNMYGGSITENKLINTYSNKAGGVRVGSGTFNMTGNAVISDNNVTFETRGYTYGAAGVYVENGTFNMTGNAKIINNTLTVGEDLSDSMDTYAGGVSVQKGVLTVGDNAQITGNTKNAIVNNVNLYTNQTIGIDSALTEEAKIGVTIATSLEEGDSVTIAKETNNYDTLKDADSAAFISDTDAGYTAKLKDNTIILKNGEAHVHSICNEANCSDSHTSEKWKPITNLEDISNDGYYYLKDNVTVSTTWKCNYDVKLCLNGKTITGENDTTAIISVESAASLDITDCDESGKGKITRDDVMGRGIYVNGTLTLWNGDITGITSTKNAGAGVYVNKGTFTMRGGAITGNASGNYGGGGVYVNSGGTFSMSDGKITGNTSAGFGGGVYVEDGSTFTMTGGKITGNNTTTKSYTYDFSAGGVFVDTTGNFTVSGDAQIRNNYWNGTLDTANKVYVDGTDATDANVLLYGRNSTQLAIITIGENGLRQEARIGVGRNAASFRSNKAQIATGANNTSLDYGAIFTSDDAKYVVTRDEQGNLYLGVHKHKWNYTQSEDRKTINATCTAAGCPATNGNGGSVTIVEPTNLTYDGSVKEATVSASNDWLGKAVNKITITYTDKDDVELEGAPTDAGEYTASITLGDATASVTYEIAKATPTAGDFTFTAPSGLTYNGEPKEATVAANKEGMGTFAVTYYKGDEVVKQPTDAGTYTAKISVEEGKNYKAASELENENWKLIIESNKNDPIVKLNDGTTYTYTGAQIHPAVTVTVGGKELVKDKDYTVTYGENKNVGDGTVIITAKDNYGFDKHTEYFTIEQAEQTLNFESSEIKKTFGDDPFTNALAKTSSYFGTITYSSNNTAVADVDENGKVTIHGVGTATITATAAATPNYNIGTATYELTVGKALIHLDGVPRAYNKIYDGTTDAEVGEVSFADKNGNKVLLTEGTDYTVKGTFSSPNVSISPQEVKVEVTLLEDCVKNYELEAATCEARATIFAKYISIVGASAKGREYKKGNATVTIDSVDFDGVVTPLVKGTDYTVTGEMADADAGTNKEVTVKVTLSGDAATNYNLSGTMPTTTVDISQATAEIAGATTQRIMKNGVEVDISKWVSFNNTDSKAELEYELLYSPEGITLNGSKLTVANNDTTVESFAIKVTAKETPNFTSAEKTITVDVVDKMRVGIIFKEPVKSNTVYGDPDFSLTADFDPDGTVPAEGDNGTWEWKSSNPDVLKIISGGDTTTPTIKVLKAGRSFLTVTYTSDTYSGGPNGVSITVNPKAITADMIGNIDAQEYTGKDIKPTPEVTDGTTKLISGKDFTYSYANNRNAGTATLTITGKGNYEGEVTKEFTISPKSIDGASIELANKSFAYTGSEQTVNITSVKLSDGTILGTDDYVIKDNSNKATNAGEITLTIEGKGNYTGTATTTWEITKINPELKDFVVRPEDLTTALTYDGTAKTVTVTTAGSINGMGKITVKYDGKEEAPINAGSYKVTFEVADGTNYNATTIAVGTLKINKAAALALEDMKEGYKYTLTGEKTVKLDDLVAGATGYTLGAITGDTGIISNPSVDADGVLKYTLTGKGKIGDTVTLPVTITSVNYEDTAVKVVITLKAKDDQAALSITGDKTVVYGKTLTLGTTGGSGTGKVTYSIDEDNSTGEATIDANGVLTPTMVGTVTVKATKAGDADYNEATSAAFIITITKASSTGAPKYTVITADGKTLADAGLTLTGSTLNPTEGTLKWVDEAGNELSDDTEVKANTTYKWRFTPANDNYDTLTGEVELWHVEAPAISAQPKNVSVMTGEKATFEVTATGTDVTYQWQIDRNDGKGFVDINGATGATYTTGVTDKSCDGFKYQCVIRNAAGSVTTDTAVLTVKEKYIITASAGENGSISPNGAVEVVEGSNQTFVIAAEEGYEIESLTVDGTAVNADASYTFENVTAAHTIAVTFKQQYKIIEGANGSWTQNTDGSGSIKIRGNGGFSKFRNVMVDGNIIDPSNYTASEGSTIIELHEDYLKTLSEGIHTLAIVWTDGSASTNFTVAKNTADDDDNDDNGGSTNTAGSSDNTAQTLIKSPKTGDASGLWIALFAASAAGLAVMLVRRKKY